MKVFWTILGWLAGSFLPTLEATYLAYQEGKKRQQLNDAYAKVDIAKNALRQVRNAQEIRQQLETAGVDGTERVRQWYATLNQRS